ncbi:MAG: hypothetical protein B6I35_08645 [Anaerolineaceae bacterium 4572_32.2]|nr:MAG: hypothetical protein B6I35_08645 [Anaerolineaceae bacterium 4572_32.2]
MTSHHKLAERITNLKWITQRWELALLLTALLLGLSTEGPPPAKLDTRVNRLLAGERFDFAGWEVDALLGKLAHRLVAPQRYMDEPARHDFFLEYLELVADIQWLEWQIHQVYTDPAVTDPNTVTVELRAQLADLRAKEEIRQPLAEAILEEQTASILVDEGFGVLGQELPPIGAHFTPLPLLLVVSPRDHVENIFTLSLRHGLDVARQEAIEGRVDGDFGVSSLVTGIGGMSAYPAMLLESSSLAWLADVTAHEWTHHYLALRPLGWNYGASPEARTINETVACIVGGEVGWKMVARYYPELLPEEQELAPEEQEEESPPPEPLPFDFRAEMRETRIHVDELLAGREIEEAEAYMEERRQEFVAQGYAIRKLNQAYFAFHGAYADQPGAAGADPIGPAVQELRARSPDLHAFVTQIARVTTLAEVESLLREMEQ